MKRIILALCVFACAITAFSQQPRVAVAPFAATNGNAASDAETIAEIFGIELQAKNVVRVYTRGNTAAVMNEHKFQMSDLASDERTASIGKAVGADWVVRGQVQKLGTRIVVTASLLDVNTLELMAGAPMYLNAIEEAETKMDAFITTITRRVLGVGSSADSVTRNSGVVNIQFDGDTFASSTVQRRLTQDVQRALDNNTIKTTVQANTKSDFGIKITLHTETKTVFGESIITAKGDIALTKDGNELVSSDEYNITDMSLDRIIKLLGEKILSDRAFFQKVKEELK